MYENNILPMVDSFRTQTFSPKISIRLFFHKQRININFTFLSNPILRVDFFIGVTMILERPEWQNKQKI